jgi:flagellar basal body-associated protein FliL
MAEKTEKKNEAAAAEKPAHGGAEKKAAKGGFLTKTPVLLGGVMVLEAAVLFAGFKLLGGKPKTVTGAELTATEKPAAAESSGEGSGGGGEGEGTPAAGTTAAPPVDPNKPCEIEVLEFRSPNKISGRLYLYDVSIYAVTKGEHLDKVKAIIQDREALIKDRVRTIIAEMDPEKLGGGSEPGLETLRRQVKFQLDEIVGDGLVDEVLIPKCIPYRSDF